MHLRAVSRHPCFLHTPALRVSTAIVRRANGTVTKGQPSNTALTSILIANRGEIALSVRAWTRHLT